jgi:hypothetical protein
MVLPVFASTAMLYVRIAIYVPSPVIPRNFPPVSLIVVGIWWGFVCLATKRVFLKGENYVMATIGNLAVQFSANTKGFIAALDNCISGVEPIA